MQFTKIRLVGRTNIDLPFFGLRPGYTYTLKSVDGLGPPEVNVFIKNKKYQGREAQDRQIVIRVGLNPNYAIGQTVSSIRSTLYGLLTPGPSDAMTVQLMNGPNVVVSTVGYVTKFEIVPFSKDPEVQITINCDAPYLEAADVNQSPAVAGDGAFSIDNAGQVTVGMNMEFWLDADMSSFTLWSEADHVNGPRFRVDSDDMKAGDLIQVITIEGQKRVRRLRGSSWRDLIFGLSTDSVWFQLHPGSNTFWLGPNTFHWNHLIYTPTYWGI